MQVESDVVYSVHSLTSLSSQVCLLSWATYKVLNKSYPEYHNQHKHPNDYPADKSIPWKEIALLMAEKESSIHFGACTVSRKFQKVYVNDRRNVLFNANMAKLRAQEALNLQLRAQGLPPVQEPEEGY